MLCADIITEMIEDDFLQEVEKGHYKLNDHGPVSYTHLDVYKRQVYFLPHLATISHYRHIRSNHGTDACLLSRIDNGLLLRGGAGSTPFHPIKYQ